MSVAGCVRPCARLQPVSRVDCEGARGGQRGEGAKRSVDENIKRKGRSGGDGDWIRVSASQSCLGELFPFLAALAATSCPSDISPRSLASHLFEPEPPPPSPSSSAVVRRLYFRPHHHHHPLHRRQPRLRPSKRSPCPPSTSPLCTCRTSSPTTRPSPRLSQSLSPSHGIATLRSPLSTTPSRSRSPLRRLPSCPARSRTPAGCSRAA